MTEWWRQPQRIVQTNLRLIDAALDPEKVAADLAELGATAMLFNVGGIFAWYPTRLELQPVNPKLDHDILGDMIRAAHARDIRVIGRYDLSKATRIAYDRHPDWFCCDRDGTTKAPKTQPTPISLKSRRKKASRKKSRRG